MSMTAASSLVGGSTSPPPALSPHSALLSDSSLGSSLAASGRSPVPPVPPPACGRLRRALGLQATLVDQEVVDVLNVFGVELQELVGGCALCAHSQRERAPLVLGSQLHVGSALALPTLGAHLRGALGGGGHGGRSASEGRSVATVGVCSRGDGAVWLGGKMGVAPHVSMDMLTCPE